MDSPPSTPPPPAPTTPAAVRAYNEQVAFESRDLSLRSTPIPEGKAFRLAAAGRTQAQPNPDADAFRYIPRAGSATPRRQTPAVSKATPSRQPEASSPTRPLRRAPDPSSPVHPLEMMDAAEAFSRMGVGAPPLESPPIKQWAIEGVTKFFPTRRVFFGFPLLF